MNETVICEYFKNQFGAFICSVLDSKKISFVLLALFFEFLIDVNISVECVDI
jgi:hypothetical protein